MNPRSPRFCNVLCLFRPGLAEILSKQGVSICRRETFVALVTLCLLKKCFVVCSSVAVDHGFCSIAGQNCRCCLSRLRFGQRLVLGGLISAHPVSRHGRPGHPASQFWMVQLLQLLMPRLKWLNRCKHSKVWQALKEALLTAPFEEALRVQTLLSKTLLWAGWLWSEVETPS